MAEIYDRVEAFLDFIDPKRDRFVVNRQLFADDHVCQLDIHANVYCGRDDLQELQHAVCKYIMSHKYSVMIDHLEYAESILELHIFDSEGWKSIFGHQEDLP